MQCTIALLLMLQVGYDGDPEAALVSFKSHTAASTAYQWIGPLFNNPQIKIFWHDPDRKNIAGIGSSTRQQQSQQVTMQ